MAKKEFLKLAQNKAQHYWAQFRIYDRTPESSEHYAESVKIQERFITLCMELGAQFKRLKQCRSVKKWRELVRQTEDLLAQMNRVLFELKGLQLQVARTTF